MKSTTKLADSLSIILGIASKDIVDALKHKHSRWNIIASIGLVLFFTWAAITDFGARYMFIDIAVFDKGSSRLTKELQNNSRFEFHAASSMEALMRMLDASELALVLPADFDQKTDSGHNATIIGYIGWSNRHKVEELEEKYTQAFTAFVGQPVAVDIQETPIVPQPNSLGSIRVVASAMLVAVFWIAITTMPYLMQEERETRTLEALTLSPATPGQIVTGKALAGLIYLLLTIGLALTLNWVYVIDVGLTVLTLFCAALLSIGLGLLLGVFIPSSKQLGLWLAPIMVIILLPPALLQFGDALVAGVRELLPLIPTVALLNSFRFAFSSGASWADIGVNLAIALLSTAMIYALLIWKLRQPVL